MANFQPSRSEIRRRTDALALVEGGEVIDEETALATIEDLRKHGSHLPDHIKEQIDTLVGEMDAKLEHHPDDRVLIITELQLRGIIARAAIAGAAQAANDLGQTYVEINHFKELLNVTGVASVEVNFENPSEPPAA